MIKHTPGAGDKLQKAIASLQQNVVKIGYMAHSHYPNGTPVAYIAAIHEHGSPSNNIPPRPTLHPSLTQAQGELQGVMLGAVRSALDTGDAVAPLETVGLVAQGKVREAISQLQTPAIKASTIAARARRHSKGIASPKPLVDTGVMLRSVEYAVEAK